MPFIKIKTNMEITDAQEQAPGKSLGQAIRFVPGKSEAYLLLEFEDRCRMWLLRELSEEGFLKITGAGRERFLTPACNTL